LVQAVVQYGDDAQRSQVMEECASSLIELSRSQYAHFVVVKLLEASSRSPKLQQKLFKAFQVSARSLQTRRNPSAAPHHTAPHLDQGKMATLAVHSVAARVVELALCGGLLKPSLSASLRLELYGKEFSVFMDEVEKVRVRTR